MLDPANAFVGKFRRDTEAGVFDKEALHLIKRPGVFGGGPYPRHAGWYWRFLPVRVAVQMFVDVCDAVPPELGGSPGLRGKVVPEHPLVPIQRGGLISFFL